MSGALFHLVFDDAGNLGFATAFVIGFKVAANPANGCHARGDLADAL